VFNIQLRCCAVHYCGLNFPYIFKFEPVKVVTCNLVAGLALALFTLVMVMERRVRVVAEVIVCLARRTRLRKRLA